MNIMFCTLHVGKLFFFSLFALFAIEKNASFPGGEHGLKETVD